MEKKQDKGRDSGNEWEKGEGWTGWQGDGEGERGSGGRAER